MNKDCRNTNYLVMWNPLWNPIHGLICKSNYERYEKKIKFQKVLLFEKDLEHDYAFQTNRLDVSGLLEICVKK